jgi:hypothetical protein
VGTLARAVAQSPCLQRIWGLVGLRVIASTKGIAYLI